MLTMKKSRMTIGAALLISMSAGLPVMAATQPDRDAQRLQTQRAQYPLRFASSSTLLGSDLKNPKNETIGSVEDFIVDRGSGRIAYAVIQSGDVLGLGGKSFALPYERLDYVASTESYLAALTEEQIERQTEFLPENWTDLSHTTWMEKMDGWVSGEDRDAQERFRKAASSKDRVEIDGTVADVTRVDGEHGESAVLRVLGKDGSAHEVVLGPTWYVMGSDRTPMRGDPVEVTAVKCDGATHAMSVEVNGQTKHYRAPNGDAQWSASNLDLPRYVLLSDLIGRSIETGGTTSGEVQRALIEAGSGRIAFIGMDPNENFLGLADTIVLVPWSVFRVGAESLALDANQQAVERAMAWPEDISTLNVRGTATGAYAAFGAEMPEFKPSRGGSSWDESHDREGSAKRSGDAWSRDSALVRTFANGNQETIEGRFRGVSTESVVRGAPDAMVLRVETSDGVRDVILGPDWYASKQNIMLREGDPITVVGRSATLNGRSWMSAWTVSHGTDSWSFWNDSTPVWVK